MFIARKERFVKSIAFFLSKFSIHKRDFYVHEFARISLVWNRIRSVCRAVAKSVTDTGPVDNNMIRMEFTILCDFVGLLFV